MNIKQYLDQINFSLKEMDRGNYKDALKILEQSIKSNLFNKLNAKDRLFIKKRISWIQLSFGLYEEGWNNFTYHWLKYEHKFEFIKRQNNSIKYLININQIQKNEKLLIWNDGGYGDFIYQLRLYKYLQKYLSFSIYSNKLDYLIRDKNLITKNIDKFEWHLPLLEIPRILNYDPNIYFDYEFNYLIKPSKMYREYENHVALTYKTETSIYKSIPFKLLEKLFSEKKNINFLILQKFLNEEEKRFFFKFKNVELVNGIDNEFIFKDTFNIINSVKFIITIDTAINHIAGYLGKKTFLLLNFPSSFYWGYQSNRSTDYNNHIIFRKERSKDWNTVIDKLLMSL